MAAARSAGETVRPLRADAQRNRDAILRAAREAFESEGVFTSLDGIAARAGVGNATLYRNFPTRDDLLAAVVRTSIAAALEDADGLARTLPPREALAEWLVRLTWQLRIWQNLPSCLVSAHDDAASPVQLACNPLWKQTDTFLDAAAAAGADGSASSGEVFELVLALAWAVDKFGDDEAAARRRVELATAGITG